MDRKEAEQILLGWEQLARGLNFGHRNIPGDMVRPLIEAGQALKECLKQEEKKPKGRHGRT